MYSLDERKSRFLLENHHFHGYGSFGMMLFGETDFDPYFMPRHVNNYYLHDEHDNLNYSIRSCVRHCYKKPKSPEPFYCGKVEGQEILQTLYDDYIVECTVKGIEPAQQNIEMLVELLSDISVQHSMGFKSSFLVTQKLILPDFNPGSRKPLDIDCLEHELDNFYRGYQKDLSGAASYWGKDTVKKLERYGGQFEFPLQFYAHKGLNDDVYKIGVVEAPFYCTGMDIVESYEEACTALKALEAAYILPAPDQPKDKQIWTQNVHDVSGAREKNLIVQPSDFVKLAQAVTYPSKWRAVGSDSPSSEDPRTWRLSTKGGCDMDKLGENLIFPN